MKNNKKYDVTEAVGDTSGFNEKNGAFDKKKKITVYASIAGIILLVVFSCLFLTTPIKAEFNFQDGMNPTSRFEISRGTGHLSSAPEDPTRSYYTFDGWYTNPTFTKGPYFNQEGENNILDVKFPTTSNITFYAKWSPTKFTITYDLKGNINNINEQSLEKIVNNNITSYMIKHDVTESERNDYVEYLRSTNKELYVDSPNAEKNISEAIELYTHTCKLGQRPLEDISLPGYTFLGWFYNLSDENPVTELSQVEPKNITLHAKWSKN